MLKQKVVYEEKAQNDEVFQVVHPDNASLGSCYDFACKYKGFIIQRMNEEQKASEAKEDKPPESVN